MKINYMTWLRNRIGAQAEELTLPADIKTIADLLDFLEKKGEAYRSAFADRSLIYVSKDSALCAHDGPVTNGDEITLFSPIVGG